MDYVIIYSVMAVAFLALDAIWLSIVAKKFYQKQLGSLLAQKPNFIAAAIFYLVYLFGLMVLIVLPAGRDHSLSQAVWSGALFGFVCYATYDLTSQAVIKNWPVKVTVIDLLWGTLITALVSVTGFWVASAVMIS